MSRLFFSSEQFQCELHCQQCDFVKEDGTKCRRRVCLGSPTCWQHSIIRYGIKIKDSTIALAGKGLFAERDFDRWEYICPYIGENVTNECLDLRYGLDGTAPYATDLDDGAIDSACYRGIAAFANGLFGEDGKSLPKVYHNVEIFDDDEGNVWLRARKKILKGEEMFAYYGTQYRFSDHSTKRKYGIDTRPC